MAVLISVVLRREVRVADGCVIRRARVDGVEVREGAVRSVACGKENVFRACPDVAKGTELFGPIGVFFLTPFFLAGLGHELLLDFIPHVVFDHFRNVGDTHVIGTGNGRESGDVCLGGGVLRGNRIRLGLLDHLVSFGPCQDVFLNEAVDQVDRDVG